MRIVEVVKLNPLCIDHVLRRDWSEVLVDLLLFVICDIELVSLISSLTSPILVALYDL